MKKLFLHLAFGAFCFSGMAQSTLTSYLKPYESNRYISWASEDGYFYLINYKNKTSTGLQNVRSISVESNYYRFTADETNRKDLYYTISKHLKSNGRKVDESAPTPVAMINGFMYDLQTTCFVSCDNPREAFGIYRIEDPTYGVSGLRVGDGYASYNFSNFTAVPFYQAIQKLQWDMLPETHPYKQQNREKIQLHLGHGNFYTDAMGGFVDEGWLVRKELDKYAHFGASSTFTPAGPSNNYTQTPGYQPAPEFCDGNAGYAVTMYNNNVEQSTVLPISSSQYPFLNYTGGPNNPVYITPTQLGCVTGYNGSNDPENPIDVIEDGFDDDFFDCTDGYWADPEPGTGYGEAMIDCFEAVLADFGDDAGVTGVTVESINNHFPYLLNLKYNKGGLTPSIENGTLTKGLYSVVVFYGEGKVYRRYYEIGRALSGTSRTEITIAPNVIQNNILKFKMESSNNETGTIYVHKLDGTLVYTENVNFSTSNSIVREIPVNGTVPYNQLRVSVALSSGKTFQNTAMTE